MKLHEKIEKIIQDRGLTLKDLYLIMYNQFQENTVSLKTLKRIVTGDTDGRGSSLHQITTALGMTLSELKKDTEEENKPVDFVKKSRRMGRYVYNEFARAELLINPNRNFMVSELILDAGGKSKLERDPELTIEEEKAKEIKEILKSLNLHTPVLEDYKILKFEKYIYCLRGTITCYIGNDKYVLKYGDGIAFGSSTPHWFENNSKSEARCLIFQNPRYL